LVKFYMIFTPWSRTLRDYGFRSIKMLRLHQNVVAPPAPQHCLEVNFNYSGLN
jgi:hypothetical protein